MRLIIATGISGSGRKEYLAKWEEYCRIRGKRVKVYHVGELMFKLAKDMGLNFNPVNILNGDQDILHILRTSVLNRIEAEISNKDKYDAVIICVHGFFYWGSVYIRGFDRFLNKFDADTFVTFIEDFRVVKNNLNKREQWRNEKLSDKDILLWQNVEVEITTSIAQFADKPYFVVPASSKEGMFYKLVFHPEVEPVYIAMPISHLREPEQRIGINRFITKLEKYFTVFNPLSVEVVGAVFFDAENRSSLVDDFIVERHVVYRDQNWFVRQAKKVIVYWPKSELPEVINKHKWLSKLWPKAIASPGVDHETHEAFSKTKDVWVVFNGKEASPFVVSYSTRGLFYSEDEFFNFLDKKYPDRK